MTRILLAALILTGCAPINLHPTEETHDLRPAHRHQHPLRAAGLS